MQLKNLENLLSISYNDEVRGRKKVILPPEGWKHVNERLDDVGTTRLMQMSRDGIWDCVDFLLRCGAEVNAYDNGRRRAIDYSLDSDDDNSEVTLLLLQWDSLLPLAWQEGPNEIMIGQSDDIKRHLMERDSFHANLMYGMSESVERILSEVKSCCVAPKYWLNSRGESALYTVGKGLRQDTWALLRASGFVYATIKEEEEMRYFEDDDSFHCAIGKHFVEISGCHVQKMVAKSSTYWRGGQHKESPGEKVNQYFKDIDMEDCTSDLLKCLQDDSSLEVVFDFSSTNIQSMHPVNTRAHVYGLTDIRMNRIYVAAKETKEFTYTDLISSLAHELAHKTLAVIFENHGLPYSLGDTDVEEEYKNVVNTVLSSKCIRDCDKIIQRVADGGQENKEHELIVRVPEMIIKYSDKIDGGILMENGFSRLEKQAPDLLQFYRNRVQPVIKSHILRNKMANKVFKSEVLKYSELLTAHCIKEIGVSCSDRGIKTCRHNQLDVIKVSNLKLGVSHYTLHHKEAVMFVDWSRYEVASDYFTYALSRNEINRLVVVWDKRDEAPFFCHSTTVCSDMRCITRQLKSMLHRAVVIVPTILCIPQTEDCNIYTWNDLSDSTKDFVLDRLVDFGGKSMRLRALVGSVVGSGAVVDSMIDELLGGDGLSTLIDQRKVVVGRRLEYSKETGFQLLRSHPECFIPRTLRLRSMEFNKGVFLKRKDDVFFVRDAEESDLKEAGINSACIWDGSRVPEGTRCFILGEEHSHRNRKDTFREVLGKLRCNRNWHFAHFFVLKCKEYLHDYSCNCTLFPENSNTKTFRMEYSGFDVLKHSNYDQNEAVIISDAPGSGKSVFMNETAHNVKNSFPKRWVGVVDLPLYERQIIQWKETDLACREKILDFLYGLMKLGNSTLERKLFGLFCQAKRKVFVFFDAFDEICPNYRDKVSTFLQVLKNVTNIKICLATRTHESDVLENHLSTIAYVLVPFDTPQQVKFLNMEWNASLKTLSHRERTEKIQKIVSCLDSHNHTRYEEEISALVNSLRQLIEMDVPFEIVNFEKLAKKLMENGKLLARGDGDFSETPLHAWMFAYVAFEENFNFQDTFNLPQLYQRFVDLKIDLYSREKAKAPEYVAGDSKEVLFRSTTYELLKRFSVFFFLEEKAYKLKVHEMPHILRIGVVVERSGSVVFVHRTFGEYLFSLWLLEKARKKKVTTVWLQQVLLESKFEKVRQFLDNLLLLEYNGDPFGKGKEWKKSALSPLAFPTRDMFVELVQKCLYTCIVEHHEGILQYLTECSGDCISEVMFEKPHWDIKSLEILMSSSFGVVCVNAFTLCGDCIRDRALLINVGYRKLHLHALKFLTKLLFLVERYGLTSNLNQMISEHGLWWMGIHNHLIWREKEGKMYFNVMFEYLARHGNSFPATLKENVFDDGELMANVAANAFDSLATLSDVVFDNESFLKFLVEEKSFFLAWNHVIEKCEVERVERMWNYMEGKCIPQCVRREFLCKKDLRNRNALFAAHTNISNPDVLPFIWRLCQKEMSIVECKTFIFDSFSDVKDPYDSVGVVFFEWLAELLRMEFLSVSDMSRLLLTTNSGGTHCYLLSILSYQTPRVAYSLQDLLFACCDGFKDVLNHMEGHCNELAPLCFRYTRRGKGDSGFDSIIEGEFARLVPTLQSCPFGVPIQVDVQEYLQDVFHWNKTRVKSIGVKVFLVLLQRQLLLHEKILGRGELVKMLEEEWFWTYFEFPDLLVGDGSVWRRTDALLIGHFFAIVSGFLSRLEVACILLNRDPNGRGTVFHWALFQGDILAFHQLYDVARWSMGEDALWKVHSAAADNESTSVLQSLLSKQELFEDVTDLPNQTNESGMHPYCLPRGFVEFLTDLENAPIKLV